MPLARQPDGVYMGLLSWHRSDDHAGHRLGEHVVFIPWDAVDGAEWNAKTTQWNLRTGNRYTIVHHDPTGLESPALVNISNSPDAVVYIRGHGNPGAPYIQTKLNAGTPGEVTKKLPIVDACRRLIQAGLRPTFPGAIKFYSCHSGTKLTADALENDHAAAATTNAMFAEALGAGRITPEQHDAWHREPAHDRSMARQGADYLRTQGFNACVLYGYMGPLGSYYEQDAGTLAWHKTVDLQGLERRPAHLDGLDATRPSRARIRV